MVVETIQLETKHQCNEITNKETESEKALRKLWVYGYLIWHIWAKMSITFEGK